MLRAQPSQFLPLSNIKEYDVYYILEKNCGLLFHFIYEWIMKEGGPMAAFTFQSVFYGARGLIVAGSKSRDEAANEEFE